MAASVHFAAAFFARDIRHQPGQIQTLLCTNDTVLCWKLNKILANFSLNLRSVFNVFVLITPTKIYSSSTPTPYNYQASKGRCLMLVEDLMPRFYFHLTSKDSRISDERGKELSSLIDAYDHARRLVEKIWLYTSHEDTEEWNVTVSNDDFDALLIVPIPFTYLFSERRKTGTEKDDLQLRDDEKSALLSE